MSEITVLVDEVVKAAPVVIEVPGLSPAAVLKSSTAPPMTWDRAEIESTLHVTLPSELTELWNLTSGIRLLDDSNYGQWGCALWPPVEVVERHRDALAWRGSGDFREGDLIIGELRGDPELVVLRCEPREADYGTVLIALGMDPRAEWPCAAASLSKFIKGYLSDPETKFWERCEEEKK